MANTAVAVELETPAPRRRAGTGTGARAVVESCKMGITRMVTITAGVGFILAAFSRDWSWALLFTGITAAVGTALSAAGANALNQYIERDRDARMARTRERPIPSGRIAPRTVLWSGIGLCLAGLGTLLAVGPAPMLVSLACILSYVAAYTPLKTRSTLNTFVGAIPGALPPIIGVSAALGGGLETLDHRLGLSLFALMFAWQLPHFLAIAWMYREDYDAGGYVMLPSMDPAGRVTAAAMTLWAWAVIPASLLPAVFYPDTVGAVYPAVAILTGVAFAALCVRLAMTRRREDARRVFFASIAHLPLLLLTLVAEGLVRVVLLS